MIDTSGPTRPIDAIVAGYLCVDIAPGFHATREPVPLPELFRPGKLVETDGLTISLGGAVANTGLAMRRFGQKVELMGCIGNDVLGELAEARLAQTGTTRGIHRKERAGTAYGIVLAPPGADRIFLEDAGCNSIFTSSDIDYELVRQSRLFHFGYPPLMKALWSNGGGELRRLLQRVRECGATVSLDMSLPDPDSGAGKADWCGILASTLPLVDIFVPSIEELVFMFEPERFIGLTADAGERSLIDVIGDDIYESLSERILAMGAKVLLIKAGHRGAYLRTARDAYDCPNGKWIPPEPLDRERLRNASGAGDCAVAGFLSALLNGESVGTAAKYAMMAGRDNLYGTDALSGLRDWTQMAKEL